MSNIGPQTLVVELVVIAVYYDKFIFVISWTTKKVFFSARKHCLYG